MLAAAVHKYVSRTPNGRGGFNYKYPKAVLHGELGGNHNGQHDLPQPNTGLHVEGDDERGSLAHRLNASLKDSGAARQHLGIARADMPQLSGSAGVAAAFLANLQRSGIRVTRGEVPVGSLKATQREISGPKVLGMAQRVKDDDAFARKIREPVIVSRDGYILDGHHRWATMVSLDPSNQMQVNRVDLPIHALLQSALAYEGVEKRDVHAKGVFAALVTPDDMVKGERPHHYLSRKPTGNPKHPYEYVYRHPEQVDMFAGPDFAGTGAAPVHRALAKIAPKDVVAAVKEGGWKEGHLQHKRSGFYVRPHGETQKWTELAYHDYGHAHVAEGSHRSEHENRQLEAIKAHLHKQGYTFNEAHFGRHSNVVLVARWQDTVKPAGDGKVRKAWADCLAALAGAA